jgi:hypothetical protein
MGILRWTLILRMRIAVMMRRGSCGMACILGEACRTGNGDGLNFEHRTWIELAWFSPCGTTALFETRGCFYRNK